MMFVISIVLASIGSLLIVWWAVRGNMQPVHDIEEVRKLLQPIDLQSFQNLIDPAQDMYLRRRLRGRAFRTVQRARRVAAAEYLWRLAQNAGILVRAGQCARTAANAQVASAGRNLASVAVITRVLALLALARLSIGIAFPQTTARCKPILEQYDVMTTMYMRLGLLWRSRRPAT
ncbi:MAG: hypothetical protein WCC59_05570 [Terriglobales bacterium]